MSRSLRRGAIAASALVISIASLTACGAGNDAQTLGVRPDNAAVTVGTIKVQNAVVITQPEGGEGPASVSATVFNDGTKDQTLESIQLPGTDAEVKLSPAKGSGPVTVAAGGSVVIGGQGNAAAEITGGKDIVDGSVQEIVFQFSETGDVKLEGIVFPATGSYRDFGPSGAPSPAASPTATTASPDASPAGSPDASPTGTATETSPGAETSPAAGGDSH
ncbi:DUF461 domain-containing protein [Streptomyces sp. TRM49041]|uniref:DUF461 domain-containing protein n=1 Tax=Streptomyces sp. TRM49041 TaxID=2603216 RepID=UPI0011F05C49|nr:DUF461 domain-containing protein [Streptomyces sp. TRM49041]